MSKVWRYGDHVDTDVIIPARYLNITDFNELAEHAMEDSKENLVVNFAANVKPGDIVVAGKNFGCGSSREHAPMVLKVKGVKCVIADSFARSACLPHKITALKDDRTVAYADALHGKGHFGTVEIDRNTDFGKLFRICRCGRFAFQGKERHFGVLHDIRLYSIFQNALFGRSQTIRNRCNRINDIKKSR